MESIGSPEEEVKFNNPVPAAHLNGCKVPPSLEEEWNPAAVSSVASDNAVSEFNNKIVAEAEESDDGSVKPSSPAGM